MTDNVTDIFDEEVYSDNEVFYLHTEVQDDELAINIEKYVNPDDNDTDLIGAAYFTQDEDNENMLRFVDVEIDKRIAWGTNYESKMTKIFKNLFDGAEYFSSKDLEGDMKRAGVVMSKL